MKKKAEEAWPNLCEKNPKEPRKRLDQNTEELPESRSGSSGSAGKNQLGDRQVRKACSWAQG